MLRPSESTGRAKAALHETPRHSLVHANANFHQTETDNGPELFCADERQNLGETWTNHTAGSFFIGTFLFRITSAGAELEGRETNGLRQRNEPTATAAAPGAAASNEKGHIKGRISAKMYDCRL